MTKKEKIVTLCILCLVAGFVLSLTLVYAGMDGSNTAVPNLADYQHWKWVMVECDGRRSDIPPHTVAELTPEMLAQVDRICQLHEVDYVGLTPIQRIALLLNDAEATAKRGRYDRDSRQISRMHLLEARERASLQDALKMDRVAAQNPYVPAKPKVTKDKVIERLIVLSTEFDTSLHLKWRENAGTLERTNVYCELAEGMIKNGSYLEAETAISRAQNAIFATEYEYEFMEALRDHYQAQRDSGLIPDSDRIHMYDYVLTRYKEHEHALHTKEERIELRRQIAPLLKKMIQEGHLPQPKYLSNTCAE